MTYRELLTGACQQGMEAHEALTLLEHLFSLSRTSLLIHMDEDCDEQKISSFEQMAARRLTGYPLQYLLGEWEFFGLPFYVGEGVLIPRADTEVLVETALELCDGMFSPVICDLCSGTGCIPIALSKNLPSQASLTAVELSEQALSYLYRNKERHRCDNLTVVQADVLTWQPDRQFDLITANPPYISRQEMESLQPEVRCEPQMALLAPEEGLAFYRVLSDRCRSFLRPGGWLVFEIGYRQGEAVSALLQQNGYSDIRLIADYNGNDRVVTGRWDG